MARLVVLVVALVAALAAPAGARNADGAATCKAGVAKVSGGLARTFCGTATAQVRVDGKPYRFTNGQCDLYPKYLVVNIGTVVLGGAKKKAYFGLLLGRHPAATAVDPVVANDGTYTKGLIAITVQGLQVSAYNAPDLKIKLKNNRRKGSFSATGLGKRVVGSFSC